MMLSEILGKVACIIVTYNRLSLLKKSIEAVKKQSYHFFDIIIVNNGSTDGTTEWLSEQKDVIVINQANLGGAGGFYAGMKYAYEKCYDWVWLMDDDGVADERQLETLLIGAKEMDSKFVNALVCNIEDPSQLSFGLTSNGRSISNKIEAQVCNTIFNSIAPFNGTLIHKEVIKSIGLIKKEMFIWGDEVEYTCRARKAGYKQFTITNAIHYHPLPRTPMKNVIPGMNRLQIVVPSGDRSKMFFRNLGYNSRYASIKGKIYDISLYFLFFILRLDFRGLWAFVKYYNKGVNNEYDCKF